MSQFCEKISINLFFCQNLRPLLKVKFIVLSQNWCRVWRCFRPINCSWSMLVQSVKVLQTNLLCLVYVGAECEGASDPGREETAEWWQGPGLVPDWCWLAHREICRPQSFINLFNTVRNVQMYLSNIFESNANMIYQSSGGLLEFYLTVTKHNMMTRLVWGRLYNYLCSNGCWYLNI